MLELIAEKLSKGMLASEVNARHKLDWNDLIKIH